MSFLAGIRRLTIFHKAHYPKVAEFQMAAERVASCGNQLAKDMKTDAFASVVSGMSGRPPPRKKATASKKKANGK